MKFPIITKNTTSHFPNYPKVKICPICNTNIETLQHNFFALNGGAMQKKNNNFLDNNNLEGFLNLNYHCGLNKNHNWNVNIDIASNSKFGQFDIHFCSLNCMQKFFNAIVEEAERQVHVSSNISQQTVKPIKTKEQISDYTIEVKHGENGWLVGQLKEKPNVLSQGKNWEELLVNLAEAFKLVQEVENEIE